MQINIYRNQTLLQTNALKQKHQIKQEDIPDLQKIDKEQVPRAKNVGERMFVDISSIKHKSAGGAKFWA